MWNVHKNHPSVQKRPWSRLSWGPHRRESLRSAWPISEPAIRDSQQLTTLLPTRLAPYTFLTAYECLLVIPSLQQDTQ